MESAERCLMVLTLIFKAEALTLFWRISVILIIIIYLEFILPYDHLDEIITKPHQNFNFLSFKFLTFPFPV